MVQILLKEKSRILIRFFFYFLESPVPLQFTPFLGILAGIILTLLFIVLVIIFVIRLKYKYNKRCPSVTRCSENDQEPKYKSFQFEINCELI